MRTLTCFKAAMFMLLAALASASLATTVSGTVVSRSFGDTISTPIPGATVRVCVNLTGAPLTCFFEVLSAQADAEGRYSVPVGPGDYVLIGEKAGVGAHAQLLSVDATMPSVQRDIVLRPPGYAVSGRVNAGQGGAAIGATVKLTYPGQATALLTVTTNGSGDYVLLDVPDGSYDLHVTPPATIPYAATSAAGVVVNGLALVHDFTLPANFSVSGYVKGGGAALPGAAVRLYAAGQGSGNGGVAVATTQSDANGRYVLPRVAYATYDLEASPPAGTAWQSLRHTGIGVTADGTVRDLAFMNVFGRVTSGATGSPLAGAEVRVNTGILQSLLTDEAGNYVLANVPGGSWVFSVLLPEYETFSHSFTVGTANLPLDFVLTPFRGFKGRVLAGGAGLASARVEIFPAGSATVRASTTTDANGDYRISNPQAGVYDLVVTPPAGSSYKVASIAGLGYATGDVVARDVALSTGSSTLSGQVTGNGSAVAGATVKVLSGSTVFATTVTGADGRYQVAGVNGSYDVLVTPPAGSGLTLAMIHDVVAGTAVRGSAILDVALADGGTTFSGVFVNAGTGEAVAGATVDICLDSACFFFPTIIATATSDASGQFRIEGLPQGNHGVRVLAGNGFQTLLSSVVADGTVIERDLVLTPFFSVAGTISAAGNGLAGAKVELYAAGSTTMRYSATTAADGRYALANVVNGVYDLVVTPASGSAFLRTMVPGFVVQNAGVSRDLTLDAVAAGAARHSVKGAVKGLFGIGLSNVVVRLYAPGESGSTSVLPAAVATTDASGNYTLSVVPYGTYELQVQTPSGSVYGHTLVPDLVVGSTGLLRDVSLSSATARITGRVTNSSTLAGVPGAAVDVCLRTLLGTCGSVFAQTTSDASGNYTIAQVPAGDWMVRVNAGGFQIAQLAASLAGSDLTRNFALTSANPVTGTVYAGALRLPGATVKLFAAGTTTLKASAISDALGNYRLPAVVNGSYDLVVLPPPGLAFIETRVSALAVQGAALVRDLVLDDAPALLSGLIASAGQPIANAVVEICPGLATHTCNSPIARYTTTATGAYSLACPAGDWFLRITAAGMATVTQQLSVAASGNQTVEQDFELKGVHGVHGTIYGNKQPLSGSLVELVAAGADEPAGTMTTSTNGAYQFTKVADGLYDLVVTPPAGSGYQKSVVPGIVVDGQDIAQDVTLTLPTINASLAFATLRGQVRDDAGNPLAGVSVAAFAGSAAYSAGATVTNANGEYQMRLPATTYRLDIAGSGFDFDGVASVALSADTVKDLTVAMVTVSGRTRNGAGQAVGNIGMSFELSSSSRKIYKSLTSDGSGNYSVRMPAGVNRVILQPPAATGLGKTAVAVTLNTSTTRDFTVLGETMLGGVVRDVAGRALPGVRVFVKDAATGVQLASGNSDSSGNYSMKVVTGSLVVGVSGTGFSVASVGAAFTVPSAGLTRDIEVPLITVSGTVRDAAGNAVAGARVNSRMLSWSSISGVPTVTTVTDAQGRYSVRVLRGAIDFELAPPSGSTTLGRTFVASANLMADGTRDLQIKSLVNLRGVLSDQHGTPLPAMAVSFSRGDRVIASGLTGSDGSYAVRLVSDTYTAGVSGARYTVPSLASVTVNGDTTRNLQLPLYNLSGKVVDRNGVSIPLVPVTFTTGNRSGDFSVIALTNLRGDYSVRLPASTLKSHLLPPVLSGFISADGPTISLTADRRQTFVLMLPDLRAPRIVSRPRATGVTDGAAVIEWQTDEPTNSVVIVNGVPWTVPGYRTSHAVAVTGLAADQAYTANVSVEDLSGNGPATASVSFRTQARQDTTPPTLLSGPVVSSISHDRATVTWVTDEAATTVLRHGQSVPSTVVAVEGMRSEHQVELTGLAANSGHVVQVEATDAAGNGPTTSVVVSFRTLPAPDRTAPVITSGPFVTEVSDTAVTIEWETDEPSTSGVSLNDGETFFVEHDDTPVTRHAVRVTGLAAATDYVYTVSSTDAHGNGPTLGAELAFATTPAPDVQPPVLTSPLRVVGITHQSAVVQWQTDEPADSTVEYGLSSTSLGLSASDAKLQKQHTVQLTGLDVDTEYFLRARSVDAAGNVTLTTVASFRTRTLPDTAKPQFTAAPTVVDVSDTTATIAWETDEPTESVVEYGDEAIDERSRGNGERKQQHQVTLTGLEPGQDYAFAVTAVDGSGNSNRHESRPAAVTTRMRPADPVQVAFSVLGVGSAHALLAGTGGFLTELFGDSTAPVFTAPPAVLWATDTMVLLGWTTDELTSAQVNGQGGSGLPLTAILDMSLAHSHLLTNLQPSTTYTYEVRARDIAGNETVQVGTFTTAAAVDLLAPVLSSLTVSDITAGVAAVALASNEPAIHEVRYGVSADALTETAYSFGYDSLASVVLTNLLDGTTYFYQVTSLDAAGNQVVSAVRTFVAGAAGVISGGGGGLQLLLSQAGTLVNQVQAGATDFLVSLAEASLPKPASNYVIRWYLDGVHVPSLDGLLDAAVPPALLTAGTHTLRAELVDTTASQPTVLRVSQAVAVVPVPVSVVPDLSQFDGVGIAITQDGRVIRQAAEGAENILVQVTGYNPAPGANHTLRWYLDGVHYPEYDNVLSEVALLNPLPAGTHTLRLEITDNAAALPTTAVVSQVVAVTKGAGGGALGGVFLLAVLAGLLRRRRC